MHVLLATHLSKTNSVSINGQEDLDVVIPIHNLIECRKNFEKRTGNLGNYYRDKPVDPMTEAADGNTKGAKFFVPLKYLSNFWRTLDMPMINCDINLIVIWSKDCVITDTATRVAGAQVNPRNQSSSRCNTCHYRHKIVRTSCPSFNSRQ